MSTLRTPLPCPIALALVLPVVAAAAEVSVPSPQEICAASIAPHPEHSFELVHDGGTGSSLLHGRAPNGGELLLQTIPTGIPGASPDCQSWTVGRELARAQVRMVQGEDQVRTVTLHQSDLPTMTAVVLVRAEDSSRVLAAGTFYTFAEVERFDALDLGLPVELLRLRGGREDARMVDEHGVGWHDLGEHMLTARAGLVYEVGKSTALEPRWRQAGSDCRATPPVAIRTLDKGPEPTVLMLAHRDMPGWGKRLLKGEPFSATLDAYSYRWNEDRGIFMVKPPYDLESVAWTVRPECGQD